MARSPEYNREYYLRNREKLIKATVEWKLKNPDRVGFKVPSIRDRHYRVNYGITYNEYLFMLEGQNNVCAICNQPEIYIHPRTKKVASLAVDHCHTTGKIRGLLCNQCNTSIGKFKDRIDLLESAIKYLKGE